MHFPVSPNDLKTACITESMSCWHLTNKADHWFESHFFLQKVQQDHDCIRNISNLFKIISAGRNWKFNSLKPGFTNEYLAAKKISETNIGKSNLFLTDKRDKRNLFFVLH